MPQVFFGVLLALGALQQQAPRGTAAQPTTAAEQRNFRISGSVVNAMGGQPIAHAMVVARLQKAGGIEETITTGEDGRFAFENLAAGKYSLFARRKGYLQQFYKQHEQFSTAIIVGPDLISENLRFEMHPEAAISGQVLDEMNDPVRNGQVMLFHLGMSLGRRTNSVENQTQTDDLGRFRFGHLEPGTYFVAVSAQPWYAQRRVYQQNANSDASATPGRFRFVPLAEGEPALDVTYPITFFPNAPDLASAAPIIVHAGDMEVADLRLQAMPALHITLRIAAPSGEGEERENGWAQVTQTIADGVPIGVPANTQQIGPGVMEISGLAPGRFDLRYVTNKKGGSTSHGQTLQLSGDSDVTFTEADSGGNIRGVAKLENGMPMNPPPMLLLRTRSDEGGISAQVEANGEFRVQEAVPPGTYDVSVAQPGAMAVKSMSATGAKVNGRSVEVSGGRDVVLNVVLSQGTGRISGFAMKDGKGVDGVMIVLVPEVPEHNLVLVRRDQSDSDGSFVLAGVHAGKYTVVAIEDGWELEWLAPGVLKGYLAGGEPVEVTPNAKLDLNVKVQSAR